MSVSVASSAGSIFSAGNCGSHSGARKVRITSQRSRLVEADPDARPEEPVGGLLEDLLRRVEQRAALVGELVEAEAEAPVEVGVVRSAELLDAVAAMCTPSA